MTTFPGSPKLLKGAIVGVSVTDPLSSIVLFQYNPDTLTRTLRVKAAGNEADKSEALRLAGPPDESIKLDVEIDAADQLAEGDAEAAELGVYPALSRLELLLYPSAALTIANQALTLLGVIEVIPPEEPLTLLVWGPKRVLPPLLSYAEAMAVPVSGSENATTHSRIHESLARTLSALTGVRIAIAGQDPDHLRDAVARWRRAGEPTS